jgi:hypothetical protein
MKRKANVIVMLLVGLIGVCIVTPHTTIACYTSQSATCITNGECSEENDGNIVVTCSGSACQSAASGSCTCSDKMETLTCSRQIMDWHCIMYPLCIGPEWCTYTDIPPANGTCIVADLDGTCP